MIPCSNTAAAKPRNSSHGYMTMENINTRRDLPCLRWDGLTVQFCASWLQPAFFRKEKQPSDKIDRHTNGYKARKENLLSKPEAAVLLIRRALAAGILADYVLMDTWFTTEPTLAKILEAGLDVIGMVILLKQRYSYQGRLYTLPELRRFVRFDNRRNIFGQL